MKSAYFISMVKGGVPGFTYREIEVLAKNGYEIALCPLTYRPGPYMPKPEWPVFMPSVPRAVFSQLVRIASNPAKYISLLKTAVSTGTIKEFILGLYFAGAVRRWGAEHIHCHFGDSKLYTGYYCSEWTGLPLTVTLHAYEIHKNPNPSMFKIALNRCRRVVVQSEFNKSAVMRKLGVPEEKISLIHAHGDMSENVGIGALKLLIVAEFREKKGHEILFAAVNKLKRKDIVVWVVGDGPLDVRKMAQEHGIEDHVVFLGMLGRDMLNILYDACDIFVLPSRVAADGDMEGIPAVLMEAMSHGKPVISTTHAGIPELVEEVLVKENDVDGLAEAISALADDSERRGCLGKRNLEIIRTAFSDQAVLRLGEEYKRR